MKISLRDILKKVGISIMICFIGLLIADKVMYTHLHKLADGSIVVHAHPYKKSNTEDPRQTHTHSELEYVLLENLKLLCLYVFAGILFIANVKLVSFLLESKDLLIGKHIKLFLGRAPPTFQTITY
ncbi:MAG: hypothetical protein JEY96_18230 [Bacteroidales bacterium]|nr:hypothetical protein [Bacteroidales bacterium]